MISSYRLGDYFALGDLMTKNEVDEMIFDNPNTIGFEYILSEKMVKRSCLTTMIPIVLKYIKQYEHLFPDDIENSTVIHVRLGDVIAGTEWHEIAKRPLSIDELKSVIPANQNVYIIGKCFFAKPSSRNFDECIEKSNNYLTSVIQNINAKYFDGGHADIDLCLAVKSKLFIQGRGFFSKLIVEIRKKLNKESIETYTYKQ